MLAGRYGAALLLVALLPVCSASARLDIYGAASLLGVRLPPARAELRAAYRSKARYSHPDLAGAGAAEDFMRMTAAYELLLRFAARPHAAPATSRAGGTRAPASAPPRPSAQREQRRAAGPAGGGTPGAMERRERAWRRFWRAAIDARAAEEALVARRARREAVALEVTALRVDGPSPRLAEAQGELEGLDGAVHDLTCHVSALRAEARRLQDAARRVADVHCATYDI